MKSDLTCPVEIVRVTIQRETEDTNENGQILCLIDFFNLSDKVIDSIQRYSKAELEAVAERLGCGIDELGDFGLYAKPDGSYLTFEPSTDLRDSEAVPLKDSIHRYFKAEVKPHVPEAWINLDTVKIGYEISFNKYFYRHKPLRSLDDVTRDILALEQKADGLIADILGVKPADLSEAV